MDVYQQYEFLLRDFLDRVGCNKELTHQQLKKMQAGNSDDDELTLLSLFFYSVVDRIVSPIRREVFFVPGFDAKGNENGVRRLAQKVRKGENIIPNLSTDIFSIDQRKRRDGMLNEWKIFHFHIPENDGHGKFVKRTKYLAFAWVNTRGFYFLDVQPHSDGAYEPWVDDEIFNKIDAHFPELIENSRCDGGHPEKISPDQRKNLRARNAVTITTANSGRQYWPCGSVSSTNGTSLRASTQTHKAMSFLKQLKELDASGRLYFDEYFELAFKHTTSSCQVLH